MRGFFTIALIAAALCFGQSRAHARPDPGTIAPPPAPKIVTKRDLQGRRPGAKSGKFRVPPALAGIYPEGWGPEALSMDSTTDKELLVSCLIAGAVLTVLLAIGSVLLLLWLRRVRRYVRRQARLAAGPALLS